MSAPSALIRQILTASGLYFFAQIAAKLLNFAFFVLLARWLSVEHFGILTYAVAVALIVDIVADLGMTRLLLRDISRRPLIATRRLGLFLPLKAALGIVLYLAAVLIVMGSHPEAPATAIFGIIGFAVLFTGASILSEQVLHSRGRFGYPAAAHLMLALTQLGGTAAVHALGGGTLAIAAMIVGGNMVYLGVILLGVHRCGVRLHLRLRPAVWWRILRLSAPYAAVGILVMLALKIEFFVLGYLANPLALGRFGGAARLFDAAMMAPLTLCAVLTPRFIEAQARSAHDLTLLYGQGVRLVLSVALAIAVIGMGMSHDIVRTLLPADYAGAGDVLHLMFFALPGLSLYLLNVSLMLGAKTQLRPALLLTALLALQIAIAGSLIYTSADLGAAEAMVVSSTLSGCVSALAARFWLLQGPIISRALVPPVLGAACALLLGLTTGGIEGPALTAAALILFSLGTGLAMAWLPVSVVTGAFGQHR